MYVPASFRVTDRGELLDFMETYSFATLLSGALPAASVTHLPLLLDRSTPGGETLLGHMARANPHTHALQAGTASLAIFHGPHAYVSPAWYVHGPPIPTWNYAVVHVRGTIAITHDSEGKEQVLKALIDAHDPPYHEQWNQMDLAYREGMKEGIVAFTLTVDRVEAKFKLSQNRPPDDRERVRSAMLAGGDKGRELAASMQQSSAD